MKSIYVTLNRFVKIYLPLYSGMTYLGSKFALVCPTLFQTK